MGSAIYTIAVLLVVLGVLVFVHELGHYWAAKAFGVWVHRFAVGMGPPIKALSFQRGETEWAIAWLPLGGYVKMASKEEDPASGVLEGGPENATVPPDRVFEAKPIWQRMVIILAGVSVNMVFALAVYIGLAAANGRQYDPTLTVGRVVAAALPEQARELAMVKPGSRITRVNGVLMHDWGDVTSQITNGRGNTIVFEFQDRPAVSVALHSDQLVERAELAGAIAPQHPAVVGQLVQGSAADKAGIEPGDSVTAIDGTPVASWTDAVAMIEAAPGRALSIEILRAGVALTVQVTPSAELRIPDDSSSGVIGRVGIFQKVPYLTESLSFPQAIAAGSEQTWIAAGTIFRTFRGLVTGRVSSKEVGGPILIGQLAAQSARAGLDVFLSFMALISVNLAVVNLLPIPVLDGGAFLMLAVEGIIRRPIPVKVREVVQLVGLGMVVLLMIMAFSNDIGRLLGGS
ncbi:MAG TPA: RIP metalloprotease RseP [Gemmatimonadales bacterium]|nr:RIP metalloprotease RseP [Gemmatimonadales bacterium]